MDSFKLHTFRPSETIDAVIKLLGRHNLTPAEMIPLRQKFNELNDVIVPRPGMTFKIPSVPEVVKNDSDVEHAEDSEAAKDHSTDKSDDRPK
jgi:hypothetical protein